MFCFYNQLPSVKFVVDRQEETLKYETEIQIAWIQIAMSDYHNEFVKVYEYFNYMGPNKNIKIKDMYNTSSYFSENAESLKNIKNRYLDKFDLVTPQSKLFMRYLKYLFDHI